MVVEVGARGVVAESLKKAAATIGMRGRAKNRLVRDAGKEACHCSRWVFLLSGKKEWEYRDVGSGGRNDPSSSGGTGGVFRHGDDR
jgi:hypothetical protein